MTSLVKLFASGRLLTLLKKYWDYVSFVSHAATQIERLNRLCQMRKIKPVVEFNGSLSVTKFVV